MDSYTPRSIIPAVVIGAGPAGLATSQQLKALGVDHVVLERGDVGECWARTYDSLTLHTGKHLSSLPGMPFPDSTPMFIPRDEFLRYLRAYRERFALPVQSHREVTRLTRDDLWHVETNAGTIDAQAVVVAAGIMSKPRTPPIEGTFGGRIRHSNTYRNVEECRGKRVLLVGVGNSAGEIASELAAAGIDTTVSVRSGAHVVPLTLAGVPIQYWSVLINKSPRSVQNTIVKVMQAVMPRPVIPRPAYGPLEQTPLIGLRLVNAIRNGTVKVRPGLERLTTSGARFTDGTEETFDDIILATGFHAAVDFVQPLIGLDAKGFARRRDRIVSTDQPNLFFVGHNYDSTGGLYNIRRDSVLAAAAVKAAVMRT